MYRGGVPPVAVTEIEMGSPIQIVVSPLALAIIGELFFINSVSEYVSQKGETFNMIVSIDSFKASNVGVIIKSAEVCPVGIVIVPEILL